MSKDKAVRFRFAFEGAACFSTHALVQYKP